VPHTGPDRSIAGAVSRWYTHSARDLPWRRPGATPWAVLVSEVMLQQTPVARVVPAWTAWLQRWPTPGALADCEPGEAVRAWDRLGYPRRALRLHAAATAVVRRHHGELPGDLSQLLALPGVGDYTARAVLAFAFTQRQPVVDSNVRRLVARAVEGIADAAVTRLDLVSVERLLPADPEAAANASAALMELGALVCTSRTPRCAACPLQDRCVWLAAGQPPLRVPVRRRPGYAGTDRQVRGALLAVLRATRSPVRPAALTLAWPEPVQRRRALAALVADGLVEPLPDGRHALPRG